MRVIIKCIAFMLLLAAVPIRGGSWASSSSSAGDGHASSSSSSDGGGDGGSFSSSSDSDGGGSFVSSSSNSDDDSDGFSSMSASGVSQKCRNGQCRTCVNGKCYSGKYVSVKADSGCPITVCTKSCRTQVRGTDGCSFCSCGDGKGTREPCDSKADCAKDATACSEGACVYNVPADLPRSCGTTANCPSDQECRHGTCRKSKRKHLSGSHCVFTYQCPNKYKCRHGACYEGGPEHIEGRGCATDDACDGGYYCDDNMTCVKDEE